MASKAEEGDGQETGCLSSQPIWVYQTAVKNLGKVFESNQQITGSLVVCCRQVRPTWQVQSLDIPTWHSPTHSLVPLSLRVPDLNSRGLREDDQQIPTEVAGTTSSPSNIALYGQNKKLKLLISNLNEEFMMSRTRQVLQYWESSDPKVSQASIDVRTGRKWGEAEVWRSLSHGSDTAWRWLQ